MSKLGNSYYLINFVLDHGVWRAKLYEKQKQVLKVIDFVLSTKRG